MYLLSVHSLNTLSFLWHKSLLIFHTALSLQPSSLPRVSDSLSCILDNLTLCPTNILHQIIQSISHLIHMNQVISKLSKPGLWVLSFYPQHTHTLHKIQQFPLFYFQSLFQMSLDDELSCLCAFSNILISPRTFWPRDLGNPTPFFASHLRCNRLWKQGPESLDWT